jgi:hypothetical protein
MEISIPYRKKSCCLVLFLLAAGFSLSAQTPVETLPETRIEREENEAPDEQFDDQSSDTARYVIKAINYNITGSTHSWALAHAVDLKVGEILDGRKEFEVYIERKTQDMKNQRVLVDEATRIDYTFGRPEADGTIPVFLDIHTKDTWNMVALPYPKFDSNSGFSLTIKARDYNFMGTMSALRIDLGYQYDENDRHNFNFLIDADFPFRFLGLHWNANFDNELKYVPDNPLYYKNTTGLSLEIPWRRTTFTVGANQYFIVNEENSDDEKQYWRDRGKDVQYYDEGWYMASDLFASWSIPLGVKSDYGELYYSPGVSLSHRYRPGGEIGEFRRGPSASANHSIGFGQVDWIGNYREGFSVSLGNSNSYNLVRERWVNSISFNTTAHFRAANWLGVSMRFMYRHWFGRDYDADYDSAGDVLRGILDSKLKANYMLSYNLQVPFRILRFLPARWFNQPKLKFMEFEMHAAPFVDMALFQGTDGNDRVDFTFGDVYITGGLEIMVFPLAWRSFYVRASAGGDFMQFIKERNFSFRKEYFIGIGHFF